MYEILERRDNGSYVVQKWGNPYHVIPGMPDWELVCAQEEVDPIDQASIYAASLIIEEPTQE